MRKEIKHTVVQEPPALRQQWDHEQSTDRAGLVSVRGGSPQPGGGWGAAFKDNSTETFQRGVKGCPCPCDRQRSSHSFKQELNKQCFDSADSTSAHALSQERRAARTAVPNLTDTFAEQFLACADKAVAGGVQHHGSWAQRGEAAERTLCPSYWT